MVNKEKVPSEKQFVSPTQQSPEKINNTSYNVSEVKSREKIEKDYSIPDMQSRETPPKRFDTPDPVSRETPPDSHILPSLKSRENIQLDTFTMPIVE
jgi:hypothetical protein